MPIKKVSGGFQWGDHGKVYPNRGGAVQQAQAAHASGYKESPADLAYDKKHGIKEGSKQDTARDKKDAQKQAIQNLMKKHKQGSNK